MDYRPLVKYSSAGEYRDHFFRIYCTGTISTFDGIAVRFRKFNFWHCFYESSKRDNTKDVFSQKRAERIDWIRATLQDPTAEMYVGWDRKRKRYDVGRRVALVKGGYVVVIQLTGIQTANFVTAYVADTHSGPKRSSTLEMIRKSPKWAQKNR